jgi:hypothetical protein
MRRSMAAKHFGIRSKWHPVMWVPHFLHMSKDGVITQYVPTPETVAEHTGSVWRFWMDLWHFEGRIVTGDFECVQAWKYGVPDRRDRDEDDRLPETA